jgi:zinc D-Ala-D-Ala carboxypeptidase
VNWSDYPNFSCEEFRCKYTGECEMHPEYMQRLQHLRSVYGKPMNVTSGYRSPRHPKEASKATPGEHAHGRAADIAVQGVDALRLIQLALGLGFTRIGVQQKGTGRFIHLGDSPDFPPGIWSY